MRMTHLIEFRDYSVYYKQKKNYVVAVDEVNFFIDEGEFVALIGASGCGKTTLLKGILGVCDHTTGAVYLNGVPVTEVLTSEGQVAYVSQEYSLYPTMTVYENIAFPLRIMHTPQEETDRRVRQIAELLELNYLLSRKPKQLSEGQHQRVAIARALIKKPRLLLLDEPFANLHPELRGRLQELMKKIHREWQVTILIVTHDMREALNLADRVVVMEDGAVVQISTPEEIWEMPKSEYMKGFFVS